MHHFETSHPAASAIAAHRHRQPYLALVADGAYIESSVDGVYWCERGSLVVHPPFHLHANRFLSSSARVVNLTVLNGSPLDEPLEFGVYAAGSCSVADLQNVIDTAELSTFLRQAARARAIAQSPLMESVAHHLAANPEAEIGAVAKSVGMSREHMTREFSRAYGMSPSAFRAEHRLRKALALLVDPSLTLSVIAQRVGYADHAHLTRTVKDATGNPPSALRLAAGKRV